MATTVKAHVDNDQHIDYGTADELDSHEYVLYSVYCSILESEIITFCVDVFQELVGDRSNLKVSLLSPSFPVFPRLSPSFSLTHLRLRSLCK